MRFAFQIIVLGIFSGSQLSDKSSSTQVEDPFAASDAIVNPESELVGKFQKTKDGPTDVIAGLSDLTVPTLPPGWTRCSVLLLLFLQFYVLSAYIISSVI